MSLQSAFPSVHQQYEPPSTFNAQCASWQQSYSSALGTSSVLNSTLGPSLHHSPLTVPSVTSSLHPPTSTSFSSGNLNPLSSHPSELATPLQAPADPTPPNSSPISTSPSANHTTAVTYQHSTYSNPSDPVSHPYGYGDYSKPEHAMSAHNHWTSRQLSGHAQNKLAEVSAWPENYR